ncbi:hypothetical protein BC938DRAFT_484050 [Jimgerdemannia flammicorona]|uniref:Zn(2)-C6 fungal-type domain-containing protein n=1 Tax=Jimgerdemannia flammicorona TaxID=994334 RepID=A0A433QAN1_9FUNG|nr:hypothetical protein BC938DRAFT_484050 [Jimgerdemannia flammicorona]
MGQNYREVQRIWNPSKTTDRTAIACTRCRRRRKQVKCDGASPRCQRVAVLRHYNLCVWGIRLQQPTMSRDSRNSSFSSIFRRTKGGRRRRPKQSHGVLETRETCPKPIQPGDKWQYTADLSELDQSSRRRIGVVNARLDHEAHQQRYSDSNRHPKYPAASEHLLCPAPATLPSSVTTTKPHTIITYSGKISGANPVTLTKKPTKNSIFNQPCFTSSTTTFTQTASLYLSMAVRVACMLEAATPPTMSPIDQIDVSVFWTYLMAYDESLPPWATRPLSRSERTGSIPVPHCLCDLLDTFYGEEPLSKPSTDDLERLETAWAGWWDPLPSLLRYSPGDPQAGPTPMVKSLRLAVIHEIGIIDLYLPFVDHPDRGEFPAMESFSHRAARVCAESAVRTTRLVLDITKQHGCRFPLFELGRACEVHMQYLKSADPEVAALARESLELSWRMVTESIGFIMGETTVKKYAAYLKDSMARNGMKVKEPEAADEDKVLRPYVCDWWDVDQPDTFWIRVAKHCWIRC